MKSLSKNTLSQNGEVIALKERKLFERIGYSLRQYIVALLCHLSTTDLSNSTDNYQDSMRKITDYILDDYIKEEPLKAEDLEFVKNHFKKRAGVHGLALPVFPVLFFTMMYPLFLIIYQVSPTSPVSLLMEYYDNSMYFYAILIFSSISSYFFWMFYGVNWFLKGFKEDVVRYTLQKSLKTTDEIKLDGITLQYYNEEGLDIHELAKQVVKDNEKEYNELTSS